MKISELDLAPTPDFPRDDVGIATEPPEADIPPGATAAATPPAGTHIKSPEDLVSVDNTGYVSDEVLPPPTFKDLDSEAANPPKDPPKDVPAALTPPEDEPSAERPSAQPPSGGQPPELPPTGGGRSGDMPDDDGGEDDGEDESQGRPAIVPESSEGDDASAIDAGETYPRPPEVRPQLEVTGPFVVTEDLLREADTMFRSPEGRQPFDGQVELADERWGEIERLQGAVRQVAADTGVDISDRFLSPEEHHIFSSKQDLHAAMRAIGDDPLPGHEGGWNRYGLMLTDTGDPVDINYKIVHETGHSVAHRSIEAVPTPVQGSEEEFKLSVTKISNGYYEKRVHDGIEDHAKAAIDEMAQDLMSVHAATKYTGAERVMAGYGDLVVIGYDLIEGAANLHGERPMDVLLQLERGIFTKDDEGLQKIAAYMGERNFRMLTMVSATMPTATLTRMLGVSDEVTQKIRAAYAGEEYRPPWLLAA